MMNIDNRQTFLGFDFGTKRIGLAIGQNVTKKARPVTTIAYKNKAPDWTEIALTIKAWRPAGLVIGIPYNMDGTPQKTTVLAKKFSKLCQKQFDLPVYEIDERLTTVEARAQIFEEGGYKALNSVEIDAYAAKIILESWLNQQK